MRYDQLTILVLSQFLVTSILQLPWIHIWAMYQDPNWLNSNITSQAWTDADCSQYYYITQDQCGYDPRAITTVFGETFAVDLK